MVSTGLFVSCVEVAILVGEGEVEKFDRSTSLDTRYLTARADPEKKDQETGQAVQKDFETARRLAGTHGFALGCCSPWKRACNAHPAH